MAPLLPRGLGEQSVARGPRRGRQAGFWLGAGPAHRAMWQIQRARQALDVARLARRLGAQTVIDRDGDEARAARQARGASGPPATSTRWNRDHRKRQERSRAPPSSPRTELWRAVPRSGSCSSSGMVPPADVKARLEDSQVAKTPSVEVDAGSAFGRALISQWTLMIPPGHPARRPTSSRGHAFRGHASAAMP